MGGGGVKTEREEKQQNTEESRNRVKVRTYFHQKPPRHRAKCTNIKDGRCVCVCVSV